MSMLCSYMIDYKSLYLKEREVSQALWDCRERMLAADAGLWTPVSSGRTPEDMCQALLFWRELDEDGRPSCVGCDGSGGMMAVGVWCPQSKRFLVNGDEVGVTHWRHLPAAPVCECKSCEYRAGDNA